MYVYLSEDQHTEKNDLPHVQRFGIAQAKPKTVYSAPQFHRQKVLFSEHYDELVMDSDTI